jgi:Ca-activated chloride channel family protein
MMRNAWWGLLVSWLALDGGAAVAAQPVVAVFELETSGVRFYRPAQQRLNSYLANKLAGTGYRVIPPGQLRHRLRAQKRASYRPCYDQACQIEIGRELAAEKSLSAKVLRLDERCIVALTLFDLKRAASERAADAGGGCGVTDVALSIERAVGRLALDQTEAGGAPDGPAVSGYGYMQLSQTGDEPRLLALKHTAVEAEVVGVMSAVKVTQRFFNPAKTAVDAIYVFPLRHRAAVHAMRMRIGRRVIVAEVKRRAAARRAYQRARRAGQTATLLEQERDNIFTQSVANIAPGATVEVELRYVEELLSDSGRYAFVFPTAISRRYLGSASAEARRSYARLLGRGLRPAGDLSIALRIDGGLALRDLRSLTHRVRIERPAPERARVELDPGAALPNRDFVVAYSLDGARPRSRVLARRDRRGGHLLLMIQPEMSSRRPAVAPREYVFVVDISGSMQGLPLQRVKQAMERCLASMRPDDRLQVIAFAGQAQRLAARSVAPTSENLERARGFVDSLQSGGGTEFLPALKLALRAPRDPQRARLVVFISDGLIGYEPEVLRFIHDNLGDANLFAFGVGDSVNRYLIDGMARLGGGRPFIMLNSERAEGVIERFFSMVSRPLLTGIELDWGSLQVADLVPARVPDLFADRPVAVAGRFHRGGSGTLTIRGYLGGRPYRETVPVTLPRRVEGGSALAHLWARRRIGALMDRHATSEAGEAPGIEQRVTEIALQYGLASKFTSFFAVDGGRGRVVARGQGAATRAALSTDQFVPGDPEVVISAPPDTVKVTLVLPSGEIKACVRDPDRSRWRASFLIPEATPDGIYAIRVLVVRASGEQQLHRVRYQVDGTAPKVRVEVTPRRVAPGQAVQVRVRPRRLSVPQPPARAAGDIGDPSFDARVVQDLEAVRVALADGPPIALSPRPGGGFGGSVGAPQRPGRYPLAVVARDHAGNKVRQVFWITVVP